MHIQKLTLHTRDLSLQRTFFIEQLGITPVEQTDRSVAFRLGRTLLAFEENPRWDGLYHYALQIPARQFESAVRWLKQRCPLLQNSEGQQVFFFDIWNAQGVYFADADGNIAELIAHHDLDSPDGAEFAPGSILGVSEIGWVVDDVPAAVQRLEQEYALMPYRGYSHPEFTAVGGSEGRFIVVTRGRPWLPTGQPATAGWFSAEILTRQGQQTLVAQPV